MPTFFASKSPRAYETGYSAHLANGYLHIIICWTTLTMDLKTKTTKLGDIDERTLRENVLVPLLSRMGFKAVTPYHGPRERGKDIICFDYDRLGGREYLAVVAKAADLDGAVSSSDSLREVLYQVEQCFDVPYEDLFGMIRITMNRVWVVTSRRIVPGAADSVFSHLAKSNLSKLVRFISGENLAQLIDQHYQAYWDQSLEPADVLKEQKNRLASFCRKLLFSLGADESDVEPTVSQVIHSSSPPTVAPADKTLNRVSPYRVEVDSIAPLYSHDFFSKACGLVREMYFKAKRDIYYAMFEVEEIVCNYEGVIKKTDPREFVESFRHKLGQVYPFLRASFGRASDAWTDIQYLEDALDDVHSLRERLAKIDKLDWATSLVDSVQELENDIKVFLAGVDKSSFALHWRIETHEGHGKLVLAYENSQERRNSCFSTEHNTEVECFNRHQERTRSITVKDITDEVQYKIREYLDELLVSAGVPEQE